MRKIGFSLCFYFILLPRITMAQKHAFELNGGAMYGLFKTNKQNQIKWGNSLLYSLGANQHIQGKYLYHVDSSLLNFETSSQYNWGKFTLAQVSTAGSEQKLRLISNTLQLEAGFGINWKVKQFKFRFSQGLLLPVIINTKHLYQYKDSVKTVEYTSEVRNYQSLGYYSQICITKSINQRLGLRFSVDFNFLNVKIKSEKVSKINHSQGLNINEYFSSTSEKEFLFYKDPTLVRNNKDALPQFYKPSKASEFIAYKQSYSGIGFKLGFVFY